MEKERRIKILSIIALIIAVLGLTVAFAALSETLTINGTASVEAASWDIHFENLNGWEAGQDLPTLNGTSITDVVMTVSKPNDSYTYMVDVKNSGTINAKVSSIEISELCTLQSSIESCDWDNDGQVTQEDVNKVNDNISFIICYFNDDGSLTTIKENDILNAGDYKTVAFSLLYGKLIEIDGSYSAEGSYIEATELPRRDLQFNDLSITINYVQAD